MEQDNNFFNLGAVSKNINAKEQRLREQSGEFLKKYNEKVARDTTEREEKLNEAALANARFGYAASYEKSKNRVSKLNEQIKYENRSSIVGMTEMVAEIVESALLLDESEYTKICPTYKQDIRDIISGFLAEGNINSDIKNPDTMSLMEYVARRLPQVKEGVSLTEDDLSNYIASGKSNDINLAIKNLSGNVSSRVASLMEKEQEKVKKIDDETKPTKKAKDDEDVDDAEKNKKPLSAKDIIDGLTAGDLTKDDVEFMLDNGDIDQATYDSVDKDFKPEDDSKADSKDKSVKKADDKNVDEADGSVAPKKQIQFLADGTMNVNIFEETLRRDIPRCGLIESLAVNEADNMLAKGENYDGDACLAKALMYVTITEAMDETGLMSLDEKSYANVILNAGGTLNENKRPTVIKKLKKRSLKADGSDIIPSEKTVKKVKKSLTETVLCSQESPRLNSSFGNDFAERLRKKRLEEQSLEKMKFIND